MSRTWGWSWRMRTARSGCTGCTGWFYQNKEANTRRKFRRVIREANTVNREVRWNEWPKTWEASYLRRCDYAEDKPE